MLLSEWRNKYNVPTNKLLTDKVLYYEDNKNWYTNSLKAIKDKHGIHTDKFIKLLGVTSPRNTVKHNLFLATKTLRYSIIHKEIDFSYGIANKQIKKNVDKVLSDKPFGGVKVNAFVKALTGDLSQVVIDSWMLKAFNIHAQSPRPNDLIHIKTIINKIATEFPREIGSLQATKEKGLGFHLRGGGSILLRNLDDASKYLSAEFAAIGIDELIRIPESTFNILRGSLRWPGIDDVKFVAATNPGVGWVRDYWITDQFPENLQRDAHQFAFVPGLPMDNPHLEASYWDMLDTLPNPLRQAWVQGDWFAAVEGLVYSEFTDDNLTDAEPDPTLPIHIAIDDGYIDPRAILFLQFDGKRLLVFDEVWHVKKLEEESIDEIIRRCSEAPWAKERDGWPLPELAAVSHEAVALRRRLREANIVARNWMASKDGAGSGSVRVAAINLTRGLICDGKQYRTIQVNRRCKNLIDELTMGYKYAEGKRSLTEKPEDGNDHAAQALESYCWLRLRRGR